MRYRIDLKNLRRCIDVIGSVRATSRQMGIANSNLVELYNGRAKSVPQSFIDKWEANTDFRAVDIVDQENPIYIKKANTIKPDEELDTRTDKELDQRLESDFIRDNEEVLSGIKLSIISRLDIKSFRLTKDIDELLTNLVKQSVTMGMDAVRYGYEKPLNKMVENFYK